MKNTAFSRSGSNDMCGTLVRAAALSLMAALQGTLPTHAADSIGGQNEKPMEITGTVVDLLCEVAKRCAPDCGNGRRQLGVRLASGQLVAVIKGPVDFAGAQADLAPLCGKTVTLDGLMFENPKMRIYQVQGIKTDPSAAAFTPAEGFSKAWTARNGAADEWFRADPLVKETIGQKGVLGIPGLEPKKP
jgi:hypothetical protein